MFGLGVGGNGLPVTPVTSTPVFPPGSRRTASSGTGNRSVRWTLASAHRGVEGAVVEAAVERGVGAMGEKFDGSPVDVGVGSLSDGHAGADAADPQIGQLGNGQPARSSHDIQRRGDRGRDLADRLGIHEAGNEDAVGACG